MGSRRMRVDFRETDLMAVFRHIHAGKSIEIVGLGSVGKSNFIRRLLLSDVQERYLYQAYEERSHCIFVPLDANSLLEPLPSAIDSREPSGWSGYELIASRFLKAVMENEIVAHIGQPHDPAHPEKLYGLYHRMWPADSANPHAHIVAYRYLEDLVSRVFVAANRPVRFIFILDEFEQMLNEMPVNFFRNLRSLRDQYKDRVLFITTVRQITPLLVPSDLYNDYEPFIELFNDSRHFLQSYRPSDADQTFERLAARQDYDPPPAHLREQLLAVTSGHAGLLRSSFAAWRPEQRIRDGLTDEEMIRILLNVEAIVDECKTIWRSMSDGERRLLFDLARAQQANRPLTVNPTQSPMARLLIRKGILLEDNHISFGHIRPVLFAAFIYSILPSEASREADSAVPNFPNRPVF